jgi:hypothetical protein
MWRRIVKTELVDETGRAINPDAAFVRFGCVLESSKAYFAILRSLLVMGLFVSVMIDWGIVDVPAHAERKPRDGDRVWYWFRPQEWLTLFVFVYLVVALAASGFRRDSKRVRAYLFMWNARVAFMPLVWTAFVLYWNELRWNASADPAYEATLVFLFLVTCLELLVGAYPSEWIDLALPTLCGLGFMAFVAIASGGLGLTYYAQLDWKNDPSRAAVNALVFMIVLTMCAMFCTAFARVRNLKFGTQQQFQYDAMGVQMS